jgi:tyrosyl-tRNA synthetase
MLRHISKVSHTTRRVYSTQVSEFLDHLYKRDVICDKTASFEKVIKEPNSREKCGIYAGFDPTADGLHVGNLLVLQTLNRFRHEGRFKNIYALVGGGTGMIGDPSGKKAERSLLQHEQLQHNISCLKTEIETFFSDDSNVRVVNNADWLSKFNMIDWLRDVGKFFQVNNMMRLESVKSRIGNEGSAGMTFTEFSYSLLQSYDFYHLNKNYGVQVQIGGSDQWGNIISGIDFIRRKSHIGDTPEIDSTVAGMTIPL